MREAFDWKKCVCSPVKKNVQEVVLRKRKITSFTSLLALVFVPACQFHVWSCEANTNKEMFLFWSGWLHLSGIQQHEKLRDRPSCSVSRLWRRVWYTHYPVWYPAHYLFRQKMTSWVHQSIHHVLYGSINQYLIVSNLMIHTFFCCQEHDR